LTPLFTAQWGLLITFTRMFWGPTKMASLGGMHYFVLFIDDFSRRYCVYTIRHKGKY